MHHDKSTVLRVLDANFNRCCEGLRVVEEYLRFVLEDPQLATECKEIRHAVTTVLSPLAVEQLHAARDATGDIGATIGTEAEYERSTPLQVAAASLKRAQQALRALEEYSKLISPRVATGLEPLRYRTYTLERAVTLTCRSLIRLEQAHIYVLLDGRHSLDEFEHLATDLIRGGADIIQLRDKNLTDREILQRAQLLRAVTRGTKTLMIVNDRLDLALLAQADGVHLGQDEISVKNAREILGPEALIGLSTHTIEQAREAVLTGADYLGCGPTFPSATKAFEQYAGLEFLRQVHKETRRPSFAIGGIDRENLQQVVSTGFNRIAVRHAVTNADDPIMVLKEMRKTLSLPDE